MEHQWIAGIKSYPWFIDDQRIVCKPLILECIGNNYGLTAIHCVSTKRYITRRFLCIEPHARFEPLPALIDQANKRYWHIKQCRGKTCDTVEPLLWFGIQNFECAQGGNALLFVVRDGCPYPPAFPSQYPRANFGSGIAGREWDD